MTLIITGNRPETLTLNRPKFKEKKYNRLDSNAEVDAFIKLIWEVCILICILNIWLAQLRKCSYLEHSGPYFTAFRLNTEIYRVNTEICRVNPLFSLHAEKYGPEKLPVRALFIQRGWKVSNSIFKYWNSFWKSYLQKHILQITHQMSVDKKNNNCYYL